eukprot:6858693-Prymnesium_polylepis.2
MGPTTRRAAHTSTRSVRPAPMPGCALPLWQDRRRASAQPARAAPHALRARLGRRRQPRRALPRPRRAAALPLRRARPRHSCCSWRRAASTRRPRAGRVSNARHPPPAAGGMPSYDVPAHVAVRPSPTPASALVGRSGYSDGDLAELASVLPERIRVGAPTAARALGLDAAGVDAPFGGDVFEQPNR